MKPLVNRYFVIVPLHETHFVVENELILGEKLLTNIIWKIQETSYIRLLRRSEVSKVSKKVKTWTNCQKHSSMLFSIVFLIEVKSSSSSSSSFNEN